MSYSGSGYLINILRRGVAPVGPSRRVISPVQDNTEPGLSGLRNKALEFDGEFPTNSAAASSPAVAKPTVSAPPFSSIRVTASPEEDETLSTNPTVPAPDPAVHSEALSAGRETYPKERQPAAIDTPWRVPGLQRAFAADATATGSSDQGGRQPSVESKGEDAQTASGYRINQVFEIKMPANFFGEGDAATVGSRSVGGASRVDTPPAATIDGVAPANLDSSAFAAFPTKRGSHEGPAIGPFLNKVQGFSGAERPVQEQVEDASSGRTDHPLHSTQVEPRIATLSVAVAPECSAAGMRSGEVSAVSIPSLTLRLPAQSQAAVPTQPLARSQAAVPTQLPAQSQAEVPTQPRLRINRLDIQIINMPEASPPAQTNSPDVSQLLARCYLARADLIL